MDRPSLLIVDDEPQIIRFLTRYLDRIGFDVTGCFDGAAALESLEKQDYEFLLTDIQMPRVNGLSVVEWVCCNRPLTRVVVMTGFGSPGLRHVSLRKGALDYLEKPIDTTELQAVLRRPRRAGICTQIDLLDYIQLLLVTRQQSLLRVTSEDGVVTLVFVSPDGIVHCVSDELLGDEAFLLCAATPGSFCCLPWCAPDPVSICCRADRLLLDSAKLRANNGTMPEVRLRSPSPQSRSLPCRASLHASTMEIPQGGQDPGA